jgi:hypothetical protein
MTVDRQAFIRDSKGKTIDRVEWDEEGQYWVMVFTDSTEMCIRLMAELEAG